MQASWLDDVLSEISGFLPPPLARAALALAVAVVGYVLARLIGFAAGRLLRRLSLRLLGVIDRVSHHGQPRLDRDQAEATAGAVTSRIVFWLVFVLFLAAATAVLGFPVVSTWLEGLAAYLPRVLAAAVILLLGLLGGHLVRVTVGATAASAGLPYARPLARAGQAAVIVLAAVIAIEELGVETTFLIVLAAVVLGAVLGGAALAFALGARATVGDLVACHYLARTYKVGHRVRAGGFEGHIVAIEATGVVLRTDEGRVFVPALEFSRKPSVLLSGEESP